MEIRYNYYGGMLEMLALLPFWRNNESLECSETLWLWRAVC